MPHHLFGGLQQIAHHAHTEAPTLAALPVAGITEFSFDRWAQELYKINLDLMEAGKKVRRNI